MALPILEWCGGAKSYCGLGISIFQKGCCWICCQNGWGCWEM